MYHIECPSDCDLLSLACNACFGPKQMSNIKGLVNTKSNLIWRVPILERYGILWRAFDWVFTNDLGHSGFGNQPFPDRGNSTTEKSRQEPLHRRILFWSYQRSPRPLQSFHQVPQEDSGTRQLHQASGNQGKSGFERSVCQSRLQYLRLREIVLLFKWNFLVLIHSTLLLPPQSDRYFM